MKILCCGILYSTEDPDTYWCIEKYKLKHPTKSTVQNLKVESETVYTLCCKKNGCFKLEIHRYGKESESLKLLETVQLKGVNAKKYMQKTKEIRIKQPQKYPIKQIKSGKNIPFVYGKSIDGETQVVRYIDESGNREVYTNKKWKKDLIKSPVKTYYI